jgi:hypothetical protein
MSFTLIEKQQFNLDYKDINFLLIFCKNITIYIIMYFTCICIEWCVKHIHTNLFETNDLSKSFYYKENLILKQKIEDLEYQLKSHRTIMQCNSSLKNELQTALSQTKKLVDVIEHFNDCQAILLVNERNIFLTKLNQIEKILIDESYNDPKNLAYEGGKWNLQNLNTQANKLNIPNLSWNQLSYAYVIRKVEQLSQIIDIIKPLYLDGYETQEMEDETQEENEQNKTEEEDDYEEDEQNKTEEEDDYEEDEQNKTEEEDDQNKTEEEDEEDEQNKTEEEDDYEEDEQNRTEEEDEQNKTEEEDDHEEDEENEQNRTEKEDEMDEEDDEEEDPEWTKK